jgi:hypothetical protein
MLAEVVFLPIKPRSRSSTHGAARCCSTLRPSDIHPPTCADVRTFTQADPFPRPALHVFPFLIHPRVHSLPPPAAETPTTYYPYYPPSNCHSSQLLHFFPQSSPTSSTSDLTFLFTFLIELDFSNSSFSAADSGDTYRPVSTTSLFFLIPFLS